MKNKLLKSEKHFISVVVVIALFIVNLLISHAIMSQNIVLSHQSIEATKITSEVNELKVRAAVFSSSHYILSQAKAQGFRKRENVIYLLGNEILAKND